MFPLTRVPCWYRVFEPYPIGDKKVGSQFVGRPRLLLLRSGLHLLHLRDAALRSAIQRLGGRLFLQIAAIWILDLSFWEGSRR